MATEQATASAEPTARPASREDWQKLSASERSAIILADRKAAIEHAKNTGLPSGLKITIGGRTLVLDPQRVTATGAVTYALPVGRGVWDVDRFSIRPNKASFSVSLKGVEMSADESDLL